MSLTVSELRASSELVCGKAVRYAVAAQNGPRHMPYDGIFSRSLH